MASKITLGEAQEWARLSFVAGLKIGAGDAEDVVGCNYEEHGESEIADKVTAEMVKCFRPEKVKPTKEDKKKISSERSAICFDQCKCRARVWNKGFGGQCSKAKFEDGDFCKAHQKAEDIARAKGDELKHGYYDEERPLYMLTEADGRKKGDTIAWADLREEIKEKKKSSKKAVAKKTSEKKDVKFPRPKGRGKSGMTWDYENGGWVPSAAEVVSEPIVVEKPVEEVVVEKVSEEVVAAVDEIVDKVEEISLRDIGGGVGLEVDESTDDMIEYDGVMYIHDKEGNSVFSPTEVAVDGVGTVEKMECVGDWNTEENTIEWYEEEDGPKIHEELKKIGKKTQ